MPGKEEEEGTQAGDPLGVRARRAARSCRRLLGEGRTIVLYIRSTAMTRGGCSKDSLELLHHLLCPMDVLAIAHELDFKKLHLVETAEADNNNLDL